MPEESLQDVSITDSDTKDVKQYSKPLVDHHTKDQATTKSNLEQPKKAIPNSAAAHEDVVVANDDKLDNSTTDAEVYHITKEFDHSNPTLMGFTVNDTMDQVIKQFGNPLNKSMMNDDSEILQIYDYPGFIIGFNSLDKIVFIEVNSSEVNPGLNDFHIGQTVADARVRLGAPDSLNEYVMIYSSNQIIMKLDIDPKSNKIQSIKLFSE